MLTQITDRNFVKREIGRGGLGVVYHGWDQKLMGRVAIKIMLSTLKLQDLERL
jgi:hypothetical protein